MLVEQFWHFCTLDGTLMIVENMDGIQPVNNNKYNNIPNV